MWISPYEKKEKVIEKVFTKGKTKPIGWRGKDL